MVQAWLLHPAVLFCISGSSCYSIAFVQSLPFTTQTTVIVLTLKEQTGKIIVTLDFSQHLPLVATRVIKPQGQALRDVEKALQIFENTRKIPTSVIEARYCVLLNSSWF